MRHRHDGVLRPRPDARRTGTRCSVTLPTLKRKQNLIVGQWKLVRMGKGWGGDIAGDDVG